MSADSLRTLRGLKIRRLCLSPKGGNWRCDESIAEWNELVPIVKHYTKSEVITSGVCKLAQPLEMLCSYRGGGFNLNAKQGPIAMLHYDVDFILVLIPIVIEGACLL